MKTLISDLKKVIEKGGDNVDEYCERLINDYIKTLAPEKQYCRNERNGGYRCIAPSFCPECRTKFE